MLAWIVFVIAIAVLLTTGIERLLARLGVRPVDPESAQGGLRYVAERLEAWAKERTRNE
jgi:hypothetical protein